MCRGSWSLDDGGCGCAGGEVEQLLHARGGGAGGVEVGTVGVAVSDAVSEAAGEPGEADGGDGGGVGADGAEACGEVGADEVKLFFGAAVDADEGVVGFAAAGVDGDDGMGELDEDAQPGGGWCFVGFEDEVGVAGAAGGVATAQADAVCVPVVGVG